MISSRLTAARLLMKAEDSAYSNLALDGALSDSPLDSRDKAFAARLFYGVTERKITLDYIISLYSRKPLHETDKPVLTALRCGVYQLLYMDSVPDNAAVNESVELTKQLGAKGAAGFVNGVLRGFLRGGKNFPLPKDDIKKRAVEYSCPKALVKKLSDDYGRDRTDAFLAASLEPHKLYLRVNNTRTSADELISLFAGIGVKAEKSPRADNCLLAEPFGSVEDNEMFRKGLYHVQDLSSQMCCKTLDVRKGERVLDICSAPGGKAFTLAEMAGDECEIYACDLREKRVGLIKSGAERLGLKSVKPLQNDAKKFNESFLLFDKILCDVPCSGYGVIRSKPEIKYKPLDDVSGLPEVQYEILKTAVRYLKKGGELVYSTCTVIKEENDGVIDRFLAENSGFEGAELPDILGGGYKTLIMGDECEGFFISKIRACK